MQRIEFNIKVLRSLAARLAMKIPKIDFDQLVLSNYGIDKEMNVMVLGANDGFSFDKHANLLFGRRALRGVLVEPIEDYYKDLVQNFEHHSRLKLINAAVGDAELILWKICESKIGKYNEGARGLASQSRQHLIDCGIEDADIQAEKVKSVSVEQVSTSVQGELDFLQIDTEGRDYQFFSQLDIGRLRPAICKVEIVHMKYWDVISMISELHNLGYVTQLEDGDCVAFLPSKLKL